MKTYQPVLSWSANRVSVSCGTSWLSIAADCHDPVRLRGGAELAAAADMVRAVIDQVDAATDFELDMNSKNAKITVVARRGFYGIRSGGVEYELPPEVFSDLHAWLTLVGGTYTRGASPDGIRIKDVTVQGRKARVVLHVPGEKPVVILCDDARTLAGMLLEAAGQSFADDDRWQAKVFIMPPGPDGRELHFYEVGMLWYAMALKKGADFKSSFTACRTTLVQLGLAITAALDGTPNCPTFRRIVKEVPYGSKKHR